LEVSMFKDFLGVGWKYPVATDGNGKIAISRYEEDIKEAILIILLTAKGERLMRPDFGCGVNEYVFSSINSLNISRIENEVREALTLFEPRIEVFEINTDTKEADNGKLMIEINYKVRATNTRFNLVYPFYLREGQ
jgi:phage baseplate assembly protein W